MTALLLLAVALLQPLDEAGLRKVVAQHRGKVVLVDFWATWCEPCRAEMPLMAALENKYRSSGLVLVTVSADEPEQEQSAGAFLRKARVRPPAYIKRARSDEDFINSVDPKWSGALPALFLYDRGGKRVSSFIGETGAGVIEAAVKRLLASR